MQGREAAERQDKGGWTASIKARGLGPPSERIMGTSINGVERERVGDDVRRYLCQSKVPATRAGEQGLIWKQLG